MYFSYHFPECGVVLLSSPRPPLLLLVRDNKPEKNNHHPILASVSCVSPSVLPSAIPEEGQLCPAHPKPLIVEKGRISAPTARRAREGTRTPRDQGKGLVPGKQHQDEFPAPHPSCWWHWVGPSRGGPWQGAKPCTAQPRLLPLPLTSSLCGSPLKGVGTSN